MTLLASLISVIEREPVPDAFLRLGIQWLVGRTRRRLGATADGANAWFAEAMGDLPIATNVEDANAQHYEVRHGSSNSFSDHASSTRPASTADPGQAWRKPRLPRLRRPSPTPDWPMDSASWNWAAGGVHSPSTWPRPSRMRR